VWGGTLRSRVPSGCCLGPGSRHSISRAHTRSVALVVPTDVGDEAQCRALVERTIAEFGRLDMLINNSGLSMWARFEELTDLTPFERMMRVNYFGSVYCTHAALLHLRRSRGRLVAASSLTGKTGVPTRSRYAATKHAMVGFFDSLTDYPFAPEFEAGSTPARLAALPGLSEQELQAIEGENALKLFPRLH